MTTRRPKMPKVTSMGRGHLGNADNAAINVGGFANSITLLRPRSGQPCRGAQEDVEPETYQCRSGAKAGLRQHFLNLVEDCRTGERVVGHPGELGDPSGWIRGRGRRQPGPDQHAGIEHRDYALGVPERLGAGVGHRPPAARARRAARTASISASISSSVTVPAGVSGKTRRMRSVGSIASRLT